jgi:hypothetical protein
MKRTAILFPILLAASLGAGAAVAAPADGTLTGAQVRELLTREGFTRIDEPEFEDGMWETDATSADGNRVDVRVDPRTAKIFAEGMVSRLSAEDVKARLTAAGYSKVHDLDFDDGVWEADAERPDGKNVTIRVDPDNGRILGVEND